MQILIYTILLKYLQGRTDGYHSIILPSRENLSRQGELLSTHEDFMILKISAKCHTTQIDIKKPSLRMHACKYSTTTVVGYDDNS